MKSTLILPAMAFLFAIYGVSCGVKDTVEQNEVDQIFASGEISSTLTVPDRYDEPGKADYVLNNDLYVTGDLIIEPGVIIEVGFGHKIEISGDKGAITSKGASGNTVVFRGTEAQPGHWMGLIYSDATSTRNRLQYTEIYHGGSAEWDATAGKCNVYVYHFLANNHLSLENCTIGQSGGSGMYVTYIGDQQVSINNCDFVDNAGKALVAPSAVINNFSATNSIQNNGMDVVEINGLSESSTSLQLNRLSNASAYYLISEALSLTTGCRIEAGVSAKFTTNAFIEVSGDQAYLQAEGSQNSPIILTATENLKGFWQGVRISDCVSPKNQLSYVTISYAGKDDNGAGQAANLTLDFWLKPASATVNNCTFSNSRGYGMAIDQDCTVNQDNTQAETSNSFNANDLGNVYINE